jgi:hypothetical protein
MRILRLLALMSLSGCARFSLLVPHPIELSESCIDGVKYIQFPSGASVKYTREGTIATC